LFGKVLHEPPLVSFTGLFGVAIICPPQVPAVLAEIIRQASGESPRPEARRNSCLCPDFFRIVQKEFDKQK